MKHSYQIPIYPHGIASIWENSPGKWSWTLCGSEGCGEPSYLEAIKAAEESQTETTQDENNRQ